MSRAFDISHLERESPFTEEAFARFGHPMIQLFRVDLGGGKEGSAWLPTAEALSLPAFGRAQVAQALERSVTTLGRVEVERRLSGPSGMRLEPMGDPTSVETPSGLPLAA